MKVSQLFAILLGASATSEVEQLLDVPRDMPVRCRFRAEWDFSRCCDASRPELLDSTCFRLQTPEGRDYAIQHCCDDRQGLRDHSRIVQAVVGMAGCLFDCRCHEKASFDCGCEKFFLRDMERIATDLRIAHRNRFWRAAGRWSVGNRSAHWNNRSANAIVLDCSENKRSGLRMLEHVLLSFAGATVVQGTESLKLLDHALDRHQLISKRESRTRLRATRRKLHPDRLRKRFKPEVCEPVHIAMVASIGEPVNGRRALATIRSALYHAEEKPLHFHLFVDQAGREDMESVLREWLEPELHRRIAKISWYGPAEFPRIWQILHARVPAECMEGADGWKGEYGSPGWMRLFPEEVFKKEPEHLIWTDAGDYLFFADPAKLLQEHLRVIFALRQMREAQWSATAEALVRRLLPLDFTHLCYRGEGTSMEEMTKNYQDLFAPISAEWAHEPWLPNFHQSLVSKERKGGYLHTPSVWEDREHPGLIDPTQAFVFCPTTADLFIHFLAIWLHPPVFTFEIAQLLVMSGDLIAEQERMLRLYRCGAPVKGMHLIRNFHDWVPWSLRLLDFWSRLPGLWGYRKRSIPARLDEQRTNRSDMRSKHRLWSLPTPRSFERRASEQDFVSNSLTAALICHTPAIEEVGERVWK